MFDLGLGSPFLDEPLQRVFVETLQEFQRHDPVELPVEGLEHTAHPAIPEKGQGGVAVLFEGREGLQFLGGRRLGNAADIERGAESPGRTGPMGERILLGQFGLQEGLGELALQDESVETLAKIRFGQSRSALGKIQIEFLLGHQSLLDRPPQQAEALARVEFPGHAGNGS